MITFIPIFLVHFICPDYLNFPMFYSKFWGHLLLNSFIKYNSNIKKSSGLI